MRIALVIHQLDPAAGGVEQWTWQFAQSMLAAGHEVHVVAMRFSPAAQTSGLICHAIPAGELSGPKRLAFARRAEELLRTLAVDVVHDTGVGWHCDIFQPHGGSRMAAFEQNLLLMPAALRSWKRRLAGFLPRHREFAELNRRQYAADGRIVLALSQMVARDMQRLHGVPAERMRIIYNGVDTERFAPCLAGEHRQPIRAGLGLPDDTPLALIVAHNFALKGVPAAIRAVGRLAAVGMPWHLAVVGGKRTARYEALARRCGAGRLVHFVGPVADAAPYYGAADLYVQPTWYDPCSLVLLEALACGLPVITTRFNGAGELLTGAEGEVLNDPGDDAQLAQSLGRYLDPATRQQAGAAARHLALRHTWQQNCRQIAAVYDEAVAKEVRRAA
ncbi:MAG: glycosyltransferase family 4 protein [Pirellulales bacterium]